MRDHILSIFFTFLVPHIKDIVAIQNCQLLKVQYREGRITCEGPRQEDVEAYEESEG